MTLTPATGPISLPLERLKTTLGDSTNFQAWAGATGAAAALARIHLGALPPPTRPDGVHSRAELEELRPYALAWMEPQAGYRAIKDSVSTSFGFQERGQLIACFEQDVPAELALDPAELDRQVQNSMGGIVADLLTLAGQAGYLATREVSVYGPFRGDEDALEARGDFMVFYCDLAWGL